MKLWLDGQCLQTQHRRATCGFRTVDFLKELLQGDQQIDLHVSLNAQRLDDAVAAHRYLAEHLPMATVQIWQSVVEETIGVVSRETPGHRLSRLAFTHHINCLAPDLALFPNPFEEGYHLLIPGFDTSYITSNSSKPEPEHETLPELYHLFCTSIGLLYKTSLALSKESSENFTTKNNLSRKLKKFSIVIIENHKEVTDREILNFNNFSFLRELISSYQYQSNDTQNWMPSQIHSDLIHSSRNTLINHIAYGHNDSQIMPKLMALSEPTESNISRLLLDSTATLTHNRNLSTGIQRVVRRLSEQLNSKAQIIEEKVIFYDKKALTFRDGNNTFIIPSSKDTIIMLDSNWGIIDSMKSEMKRLFLCRSRLVTCIYDMIPLHYPGMVVSGFPEEFTSWLKFILSYSDSIICISRAVADEVYTLLEEISFPLKIKIGFWKLGADMLDASRFSHAKYSTKKSKHLVFITVGTLEIRKGHRVILEAFEELWSEDHDIKLQLVGTYNSINRHFIERLKQHPELGKRLHWHERLDDHGLAELYADADALILASYAEGFGLPIAEAGYFGKPVIVSDLPVFREVSAAAPEAFFFTPGSAQDLAAQIRNFIRESQNGTLTESKPVAWPTWAESMDQLRSVVLKDQYYKIYEPKVKQDPFKIDYIGEIYTQFHLPPNTQKYHLHVLEEPHISQRGCPLEIILFVKNLSDQLYASNQDLGYKLGVRLGARPAQDNSMATGYVPSFADIPFVLLPGHQLVMRISCPWTNHPWWRNRITAVEIDLLQVLPDGYNWWGQSPLRVDLPPHGG